MNLIKIEGIEISGCYDTLFLVYLNLYVVQIT